MNRLEEARDAARQAKVKNPDSSLAGWVLYELAFLNNDALEMDHQVASSAGKPGLEDQLLNEEARTAAYFGRLEKARTFFRLAVASAERAKMKEAAAGYEAGAGLTEAHFGNQAQARRWVASVLRLSTGRDAQYLAALALALTADTSRAQALANQLSKRFPEDTVVQFNYLPTLDAQFALNRNDALRAVAALNPAVPIEAGGAASPGPFYPAYVRGLAYLAAHQGTEAASEFRKILDHRGLVLNHPIGALAHLQLGRALAMQGDTAKATTAYQDFLTLWSDADPNIPILKKAKAEYAALQ